MQNEDQSVLAAILLNAVDAIILIDENGLIKKANPATERLFGFDVQELIGKNVNVLMPSPYHEEHDRYLENYRRTGEAKIIGIGREIIGKRKDGSTFPIHLAVSEIKTETGRYFAGIVHDISDLKHAEQKLKELNEALEERVRQRTAELRQTQQALLEKEKLATLGQVSGGIAHEIRNPLNAVKTSAYYLLHAKSLTEEKRREHLTRIDRQVTLIDNVVTALADVARMPEPHSSPCQIDELTRSVVAGLSLPPNITVVNEIPAGTPTVFVDPNQLSIVLRNLIRNARDAIIDAGTITLSADWNAERVRLRISDDGVGIEADKLDRIMEPLYSTKARGMGLGLAISLAIVEKNGCTIDFESEPGVGTTFEVGLPMQPNPSKHRQ
jgi:two-component system sensor kinase FixL